MPPVLLVSNSKPSQSQIMPSTKERTSRGRSSRDFRNSNRIHDSTETEGPQISEKVVFINRCAKVVKGGRRFSFSALVVSGDQNGRVGCGFGKANEVSEAIRKATDASRKSMKPVVLSQNTIPHETVSEFGGARILLRPASPGTGIIAGGGVRAVMEAAGVRDVLAKSLGSANHANVVKATLQALYSLRGRDVIYKVRGLPISSNFMTSENGNETPSAV